MSNILIMLSTYNGEQYLRQQLDSLFSQVFLDFHILVRDDGSSDKTLSLLEEYMNRYGNMTILACDNIGASKSFHALISYASKDMPKYDYYAFCDQDDVWYSDKLETALSILEQSKSIYNLYFCSPEVVDSNLKPIQCSRENIINNIQGNIVASHILGCTMVFNYALLEKVSKLSSNENFMNYNESIPLHDGWVALVAYAFKAFIFYDKTPHIKYRQHEKNVVGAVRSPILQLRHRIERYMKSGGQKRAKCSLAYDLFATELDIDNRDILHKFQVYPHGIKNKCRLLFDKSIYQYDFSTNMGLAAMILLNRL